MIYRRGNDGNSRAYAKCKCECGQIVIRTIDSLKYSKMPSCGCKKAEAIQKACRKDLTGQRFGRLVVKQMIWRPGQKSRCLCACDCGCETVVVSADLSSGHTMSCGCLQREATSQHNTKSFAGKVSEWGVRILTPDCKNSHGVWLWECECGICGQHFSAMPARVLNGHIKSCGCARRSTSEALITRWLTEHGVAFETEYSYDGCRNKYRLRFDFAIFDRSGDVCTLIEYDGEQHTRPSVFFGGADAFQQRVRNDRIKDRFCEQNHIPLIRIPFDTSINDIYSILSNIIYP